METAATCELRAKASPFRYCPLERIERKTDQRRELKVRQRGSQKQTLSPRLFHPKITLLKDYITRSEAINLRVCNTRELDFPQLNGGSHGDAAQTGDTPSA